MKKLLPMCGLVLLLASPAYAIKISDIQEGLDKAKTLDICISQVNNLLESVSKSKETKSSMRDGNYYLAVCSPNVLSSSCLDLISDYGLAEKVSSILEKLKEKKRELEVK